MHRSVPKEESRKEERNHQTPAREKGNLDVPAPWHKRVCRMGKGKREKEKKGKGKRKTEKGKGEKGKGKKS